MSATSSDLYRSRTPSVASEDEDGVLISTPSPSEPDTFPDYIHIDMDDSHAQNTTHTSPQEQSPPPIFSVETRSQPPSEAPPSYAASTASSSPPTLCEKSPMPESPSTTPTTAWDPEKAAFVSEDEDHAPFQDAYDDPPESTLPADPSNPSNPLFAAATAALSLTSLLALFTARTLYTSTRAASSTLYSSISSDLRSASGDLHSAFADLHSSLGDVRREFGDVRQDVQGIVRETGVSIGRDVREVREQVARELAEAGSVVREVGVGALGDVRGAVRDIFGVLDEVRRNL